MVKVVRAFSGEDKGGMRYVIVYEHITHTRDWRDSKGFQRVSIHNISGHYLEFVGKLANEFMEGYASWREGKTENTAISDDLGVTETESDLSMAKWMAKWPRGEPKYDGTLTMTPLEETQKQIDVEKGKL